jgi:hypothetical protein
MMTNKFGELIMQEQDLIDLVMRDHAVWDIPSIVVDESIDVQWLIKHLQNSSAISTWATPTATDISVQEFDQKNQSCWFMPKEYLDIDIAQFIIGLANDDAELQRLAQELLLYQERNLFDLLRYLRYLVSVMRDNNVIWGVGRGSSVASFVLYKLGVHRINSLYYDLDPTEFLR